MPFVINQAAAIYWRVQGLPTAQPLVLLHSIGTDLTIYDEAAPLLESDFNVLRTDLRGHGASQASDGDSPLTLLARDVLAAMDDAGLSGALICGTSLGGMVAMELARISPQRVDGLALANTSAAMDPALWPGRIAMVRDQGLAAVIDGWAGRHLSAGFIAANPSRVATLERAFGRMDPRGYAGCAAAMRDMDLLTGLPAIRAPTLVIGGDMDTATPFAGHGERIAAAIPGAETLLLPTGHLACIERPDLFAQALRALAARCADLA